MTRLQIVYWRDIPVHVKVRDGEARLSRPLTPRFQQTVHRAAYRARSSTALIICRSGTPDRGRNTSRRRKR